MNKTTFAFSIVAALALGVVGCGDSSSNGGTGGTGGGTEGEATVMAAHFAPEVPAPGDTAVAIYVNGEEVTALGTLSYGQSTGRVPLPAPATYDIGIGLPGGDGPLLELEDVALADGDDIAAVAYRTTGDLPVALFAYNLSTEGLASGSGRLFVSHGANDSLLNPVDIILTDEDACPPPLLDQLAFGETRPGQGADNLDLPANTYNLGFDLDPGDCTAELGFSAPVTADVTTLVVAVDEDTTDESINPQVWAIVDASDKPVPLIANGEASVTAAHFAPEVPAPGDTAVAIYVNGEEVTALGTLSYGQSTGRVPLPAPATYDIGIGLPGGDGPLLELEDVALADGDDIAAVAYRTTGDLPVALFAYNLSTEGLASGSGRLFVSHGANDSLLNPVDIILTDEDACPPPLLDQLAFGETRPGQGADNLDLPANTYNLGFDLDPGDCTAELGFSAPVTADVTTLVVAVDEDTIDESINPQVWAIVDASNSPVALIAK